MVLRIEPIAQTLKEQKEFHRSSGRETHTILVTPQGRPFSQEKARELSRKKSSLDTDLRPLRRIRRTVTQFGG